MLTFKDYKHNFVLDKDSFIKLNNFTFFYVIYTHQTHYSFNSDLKFKNDKNYVLNKFYNFDFYLGKFFKWFENSNLRDDTIIILTADHAHYGDMDYKGYFKNSSGHYIDKVVLGIYSNDIKPITIDTNNLSSLDLTLQFATF